MHPATPVVLYTPVVLLTLYLALAVYHQGAPATMGMYAVGLFFWTLTEYTLHRFVFHHRPSSGWGKRLHFIMHGVHHAYPNDATRLVMAPAISIPLALLFYWLFGLMFGPALRPAAFAGLISGYICYDTLRYATHHWPMKRGIWRMLKHYHMRHHYQNDEAGYGVTSPVWDFVFGTRLPPVKRTDRPVQGDPSGVEDAGGIPGALVRPRKDIAPAEAEPQR
jgi:sterol desaturase/sphingolipid hydroxylase (fatty acid hydroxylase superfamily)